MAGHSQFKNIMHRKGAQDKKRAKVFTKILREITVAAKLGSPDINSNPRLRAAILEARSVNMPKDNIDRAIKKVSTDASNDNYENIRYEGYGPFGIAFIIETLTDNRNRTAPEVRAILSKHGGSLGESGSVSFMFDRLGVIKYSINDLKTSNITTDELLTLSLEEDIQDIINTTEDEKGDEEDEDEIILITKPEFLHNIANNLSKKANINPNYLSLSWQPKSYIELDQEQQDSIITLIDLLEEMDDVQRVFHNLQQ